MLQYAPKHQLLLSGGRKGHVSVFDIRQRQALHTFQAHDSSIKALSLDASEECFCTGSAEGNVKVGRRREEGMGAGQETCAHAGAHTLRLVVSCRNTPKAFGAE